MEGSCKIGDCSLTFTGSAAAKIVIVGGQADRVVIVGNEVQILSADQSIILQPHQLVLKSVGPIEIAQPKFRRCSTSAEYLVIDIDDSSSCGEDSDYEDEEKIAVIPVVDLTRDFELEIITITDMKPFENKMCTICREHFELGAKHSFLPCSHNFHFDCINQWLIDNRSCPNCKLNVDQ